MAPINGIQRGVLEMMIKFQMKLRKCICLLRISLKMVFTPRLKTYSNFLFSFIQNQIMPRHP